MSDYIKRMRPLASLAGVLLGISFGSAARAQFVIGQNFTGTSLTDLPAVNNGFAFIPPDTMGAIGPNHFVEFTNGTFAVYNKTTGALANPRTSLTQFWQNAGATGLNNNPAIGTGTTDPHVLFDPVSGRWFAVTIDLPPSGVNRMLIAVSKTSDPTAGWTGFAKTNPSSPGVFADYPMVGIDKKALIVATNNFPDVGPASSTGVFIFPKADLTGGVPTIANAKTIANINFNTTGFSPYPIVDFDSASASHDLLSSFNSTNLRLSNIPDVLNASPTISGGNFLAVTGNINTLDSRQPGGPNTIDSGDTRFGGNVVRQGNFYWSVNTITSAGHEVLRWYRIDAATGTLAESGLIGDGDVLHDYYYGSIAVNANGDAVIGYTRSGPSEVPGTYASIGKFNGSSTSFGSPTELMAGAAGAKYNLHFGSDPRVRWGDYSQTTIDPSDPFSIWTIQEFVTSGNPFGSGLPGNWATQITEIRFDHGNAVPEPGALALLGGFGVTGGLLAVRRRLKAKG